MSRSKVDPPGYSHDLAVQAITSYYSFIEKMCLPPGSVDYPPPDGWALVTPQTMRVFNKNDDVVKLLKHIPYFTGLWFFEQNYDFAHDCQPIHYRSERAHDTAAQGDPEHTLEPSRWVKTPPHAICLANGHELYSYSIVIDTQRGVALWGCPMEKRVGPKNNPGDDLIPTDLDYSIGISGTGGPDAWLNCSTYPIDEFFELWKENFRSMQWLPDRDYRGQVCVREVSSADLEDDDVITMKRILVDAGWPGDGEGGGNWNKAQAELEVRRLWG